MKCPNCGRNAREIFHSERFTNHFDEPKTTAYVTCKCECGCNFHIEYIIKKLVILKEGAKI